MKYTIIEDCSPYYIRFKYDGMQEVADYCKTVAIDPTKAVEKFTHQRLLPVQAEPLIDIIPFFNILDLRKDRVSLFTVQPGYKAYIHKDGLDMKFGINYAVTILDGRCVTRWYDEGDMSTYDETLKVLTHYDDNTSNIAKGTYRELAEADSTKHCPVKQMTVQQNDLILFNTDIYHDYDNTQSSNHRVVLTLRPSLGVELAFNDVKKMLFGV
jgi:hypothetical protein